MPATPAPGADPASQRGSTTLDLVLATSTELFAERGYAAASMRQLADRANLPLGGFYYYFRRKYDVLLAIIDTAMGRLEAAAEEALDESLEPADQLRALVESHVRVDLLYPASAGVADREIRALEPADRKRFIGRRDRYERRFRDLLAAGAEAGSFDRELDIPTVTIAILTMCTSVIDWWRPDGRHSVDETAALIADYSLRIVLAPPR